MRISRGLLRASMLSLASMVGAPTAAPAQDREAALPRGSSASERKAEVAHLLGAGIDTPLPPARYLRLGQGTVAALIACYRDPSLPRPVRLRALSVLARFPPEAARSFFVDLLHSYRKGRSVTSADELHPSRSSIVVRRALKALAEAETAGRVEPAPTEAVRPCLAHADPKVRRAAVRLLGHTKTREAHVLLQKHRKRDRSPLVQRAMEDALRRFEEPHEGETERARAVQLRAPP